MKKKISDELAAALGEMAKAVGKAVGDDGPFHIITPRICDLCKDEDKEAFPYGAVVATGKYNDLCNDCYDALEKEAMQAIEEIEYQIGYKQAWLLMLKQCIKSLGYEEKEPDEIKAAWIQEREETILVLRNLCSEYGDNNWPDDLHLRDVIQKHLVDYLKGL